MGGEYGQQMHAAIKAVLNMHADCIRLIRDLDRAMPEYEHPYGNVVTLNLGSGINRPVYLAEGLIRLYNPKGSEDRILGVNLCFFEETDRNLVPEPTFVVAQTTYKMGKRDAQEKQRIGWDPWTAFFAWAPERSYNQAFTIHHPPKRESIENVVVAAAPLEEINEIASALRLIDLVGRP